MTAQEARNKSLWSKLPLDIRQAIEHNANNGHAIISIKRECPDLDESILVELGYNVWVHPYTGYKMIEW